MSLFKAPKKVVSNLEKLIKDFFWGSKENTSKIAWVKWKSILKRKDYGGLGIGSIGAINTALLAKWVWRFRTEPNATWVKIIKAIHGSNGGITSSTNEVIDGGRGPWRNIISVLEDLNNLAIPFNSFCNKQVGNGLNTQFWKDKWSGNDLFKDKFPRIFCLEVDKDALVADRISSGAYCWNWRRELRGGREQSELNELRSYVGAPSLNDAPDIWQWKLNPNGAFDVKSLRKEIEKATLGTGSQKTRWSKLIPAKINIFFWRASLNRIPCKERLITRGVDLDNALCLFCNLEVESVNHLFFSCSWAKELWSKIGNWWSFSFHDFSSMESSLNGIDNALIKYPLRKFLEAIVMVTCYSIWCFRNRYVFDNSLPRLGDMIDFVVDKSFGWIILRRKEGHKNITEWRTSPCNCLATM